MATSAKSREYVGAVLIKCIGAAASFGITTILAKKYGAIFLGQYTLVISSSVFIATICLLGLEQWTIRSISGDIRDGERSRVVATYDAVCRNIAGSVALSAVILAGIQLAFPGYLRIGFGSVVVGLLLVAVSAANRINVAALRGIGLNNNGQMYESAVSSFGTMATLAILVVGRVDFSATAACAIYLVWLAVSAVAAARLFRRRATDGVEDRALLPQKLSILVGKGILVTSVAQAGTDWVLSIVLGSVQGLAEVGVFRIAFQVVTIVAMVSTTLETTVSSRIAASVRSRDLAAIRRDFAHARNMALILIAVPLCVCFVFAPAIVGFFGPAFADAVTPLRIMLGAQLFSIAAGPAGVVVVMSGRETIAMAYTIAGLVLAVVVIALTAPSLGATGAALGYAAAVVLRKTVAAIYTHNYLKLPGSLAVATA